ncbi:methyltransferase domain-containing protein [Paracoccus xiamenensis]|uniref:methyltransferase domain-containing protein n=1 Tax=Paracoccus xiamenensis TaxID=2714901 RepID=UPI00140BD590|nr:methyltransferase domain-containing protein [Paracoccus xiamenensis]NHF72229.1 glycosyltransferase family 4 protein [Paracoccus xiamenensis]
MRSDAARGFIPELLALMPLSAREVLICGSAELAEAYRSRNPAARLTGFGPVEMDGFDRFVAGDPGTLSKARLATAQGYDLAVLDETLGKLRDPGALLRRLRGLIRPGGTLVVASPNRAYWRRLSGLISGETESAPGREGALDQSSLQALMGEAGFFLRRMRARRPDVDKPEMRTWLDALEQLGRATGLEAQKLRQRITASDFVVVAAQPPDPGPPLNLHLVELALSMDVRTRIPAEALRAEPMLHVTTISKSLAVPDMGTRGGVVVVQRPRVSDPERMLDYVARCQQRGIVVVIEYDDDPSLVARVLPRADVPSVYAHNMSLAHAIQTSTPALATQFGRVNPEVAVFANTAEDVPPLRMHAAGALRVLFAALHRTRTAETAALFAPAIEALPDLEFDVVFDRAFFDALPTSRKRFHKLLPYRDYLALMGRADVALMPLEGRPEELGKSDVKWVEAASRSAVALASVPIYAQTIRDGENGLLARSDADWSRLLIKLGGDPDLRNRIATTARAEVVQGRMMAAQVATRRDWHLDLYRRRDGLFRDALRRSPALADRLASL